MFKETLERKTYDPSKALYEGLEKIRREHPELGRNVEVTIEIGRHGAKEGEALSELGKEQAAKLGKDFPSEAARIVGYGSTYEKEGTQRAMDTVKIAVENAPEVKNAALSNIERIGHDLDWTTLKNPWNTEPYKRALKEGPEKGWDKKQIENTGINETLKASPDSAREVASRFAHWIKFFINSAHISRNGEKNFYPVISHGIMPESFLKHALVRADKESGEKTIGYEDLEEIGGSFDVAEAMDISTKTDEEKNIEEIRVSFKNPGRAKLLEKYDLCIDKDMLEELDKEYEKYV